MLEVLDIGASQVLKGSWVSLERVGATMEIKAGVL